MAGSSGTDRGHRSNHAHDSHVCINCRQRRSLFRYRGRVRADRSHTVCFQCYRALHNVVRALRIAHRIAGVA